MAMVADLPETRYAETGQGSIAYQVVGDGPLDVIAVSPYFCPIDLMWDEPHFVSVSHSTVVLQSPYLV